MTEPRSHYQISLTARQAVGLFVGLLLALGLAFFFGLMTGLGGHSKPRADAEAVAEKTLDAAEPMPPIETAVPAVAAPSAISRTELAGSPGATPVALEPTTPATLQPFEDSSAEESSPVAAASSGKGPAPASKTAPPAAKAGAPSAGKVWVQVASLSSRDEASSIAGRLSRHGFHTQILTASGPKGKVYRVRVGPYRSEDDAGRAAARLNQQEKIHQPWVVPDGK